MTLESLERGGDPRVLGWIKEAVAEGDRINRSDPGYDKIEQGMRYVSRDQRSMQAANQPSYIPPVMMNESRRVVQAHASSLTDLKPVFSYRATDPAFSLQADLQNKLTVADWIDGNQDMRLADVVKYALAGGTGDMTTEWNPYAPMGGRIVLNAKDPRDTLPIRPPSAGGSDIQTWEGLILREGHTVNAMQALFPDYRGYFRPTTDSLLSTLMGRVWTIAQQLVAPGADTLAGLQQPVTTKIRSGEIILYRTYLNDRSRNLTQKPIPMGRPGSSWSYVVAPGGYLYPYKRLIVSTPEAIVYDGPNTYWHGQYPVSRLKLIDFPWRFLGTSLLNDLAPIQDAVNMNFQDFLLGLRKWMDPATVYNRGSVSENFMRLYDARRPGAKVKLNLDMAKDAFKQLDGPPAQVLALALQAMEFMLGKFDSLSGTPNLQQLLELRQVPGAETIQKYWEALTPEIRSEGRQVEAFLRPVGEQMKVLRLQFESNARRVTILGEAGNTLEDFDMDPEVLVPAMSPGDPRYQPEFDGAKSRDQRAQALMRKITFIISPNSILNINATETKMMKFQLARMGWYDIWSTMEALEIGNIGAPPPVPLPPLEPVPADIQAMLQQQQLMMAIGAPGTPMTSQVNGKQYILDQSGQVLEIRAPITVVERLQAQATLGIGVVQSPAGRPASGQAPPKLEQKGDGRTTITESDHSPGPNSGGSR